MTTGRATGGEAMNIALSLRAKGVGGLAARVGTITSRFGLTARPMEHRLNHYTDLTAEFGSRPTLAITASVLARHPGLIQKFVNRDVEFAIHGLVHNDHAGLGLEEQRESITQAAAIFRAAGVPYAGFRGPYLRYNQATHEALRNLGMRYHSSQAVAFAVLHRDVVKGPKATAYQRALHLYGAPDAAQVIVRPRDRQGLIEIPVAVPDDEIMVDRLHLDKQAQAEAWLAILEMTHARGDLFTMQLHPERIFDSAYALQSVLEEARRRQPAVWIAGLDEIASWWLRRQRSVLEVQQLDNGRYRVHLEGEPEATLLVRELPTVDTIPWYGRDLVARVGSFELASAVKPVVGVSTQSPKAVLDLLYEEGLPAEISDDREQFGAYIDIPSGELDEVGVLTEIERAPGPLVRLGRWPSGARSALAVTGDIDSITLQDFALRLWETR